MGVTGLLLVGFAVNHLVGNLKLLPIPFVGDAAGEKFDEYVAFLKSFGGLLYVAEIGLVVLFGAHIWLALKLTMENREARKTGYHVRSDRGAKSVGSASMHVTGALLLAFLIKHMLDFRFDEAFHETPAAIVYAKLAQPANALIYMAAGALLGVHLSHGFRSVFQSLGLSHPKWDPLLVIAGRALAVALAIGFAIIPLYILIRD